jgi:26S proteasome regulatory subunit N7
MGSDPQYAKYPNMLLSQHIFTLRQPSLSALHPAAQKVLTDSINEHAQAPLYRYLAHPTEGVIPGKLNWDEAHYNELKKKNDEELEKYQKELEEAGEKAGESEIVEAMGKTAEFWARVVDKVRAMSG